MNDKDKLLAKLAGGFVWRQKIYVPGEIKQGCDGCAFYTPIRICDDREIQRETHAVRGNLCMWIIWVEAERNERQKQDDC